MIVRNFFILGGITLILFIVFILLDKEKFDFLRKQFVLLRNENNNLKIKSLRLENFINSSNILKDISLTQESLIFITDDGFQPSSIEITVGSKVTFINISSKKSWLISDEYNQSSMNQCHNGINENVFNSCRALLSGEKFTFIFNKIGNWNYYDFLNKNFNGKIIVKNK